MAGGEDLVNPVMVKLSGLRWSTQSMKRRRRKLLDGSTGRGKAARRHGAEAAADGVAVVDPAKGELPSSSGCSRRMRPSVGILLDTPMSPGDASGHSSGDCMTAAFGEIGARGRARRGARGRMESQGECPGVVEASLSPHEGEGRPARGARRLGRVRW